MKTLALVTQKGGSGKTTLSISLAVAAMEAGETVVLIDMDRQQSTSHWFTRREADEPAVVQSLASELASDLAQLKAEGATFVIIDTAGIDEPGAGASEAMRLADFALVPAQASFLDVESCSKTAQRLLQLKRPFAFVLNEADPQRLSTRNAETREALVAMNPERVWVTETPMVRRMAHRDAVFMGLGVTEFDPSGKAAKEIRALYGEVCNAMGKGADHEAA